MSNNGRYLNERGREITTVRGAIQCTALLHKIIMKGDVGVGLAKKETK
jgi:hypothetical protein